MQQLEQTDRMTEIMKKYGPQDCCYAATYEKKYEILLQKFFERANETRINSPLIIHFFEQMKRRWNDHEAYLEGIIQIQDISKADDIPTIQGLSFCMRQLINTGLAPWRYIGAGSDNREARCYQPNLYAETFPRADMTIPAQGSITRVSSSMRFVGIFPSTFPTITVRESAVFNVTDNSGTMLNRNMFSSFPITHTVNVAPFTLGSLINWAPVTTWG